jgi:hypothetical protein
MQGGTLAKTGDRQRQPLSPFSYDAREVPSPISYMRWSESTKDEESRNSHFSLLVMFVSFAFVELDGS